jgi:hypothetical protein
MTDTGPGASLSRLGRNDQLFLGGSLLALICTFLSFDGINLNGSRLSENAWHELGVLASLLVLVVFVVALAQSFAKELLPDMPVSLNVLEAGGMAAAALLFLIRWLTLGSTIGFKIHLRWGGCLVLIITIVTTVIGVMRMREAGEPMPWENRGGTTPTAP